MRNPRLRDKHLLAGHYATELTRDLNGAKCRSGLRRDQNPKFVKTGRLDDKRCAERIGAGQIS